MLPSNLLNAARGSPMLVELKNGETYNGHLINCDNFMNMNLKNVICTSPEGDRFWQMSTCYLRGTNIKYLRIPDEVMEKAKETQKKIAAQRQLNASSSSRGRGGKSL